MPLAPCHSSPLAPSSSAPTVDTIFSSRRHIPQTPCARRPSPCCSAKQLRQAVKIHAVLSKDPSPKTSPPSRHLPPGPPPASSQGPSSATPSTSHSPSTSRPSPLHLSSSTPPLADPRLALKLNHLLRTIIPTDSHAFQATSTTPSHHPQPSALPLDVTSRNSRNHIPGPGPSLRDATCWYFAYGSNLHKDSLFGSDVTVLSRDAAVVCDPNVHLVFRHKGGQATLMRLPEQEQVLYTPPGSCVHGVLYRIDEKELRKLKQLDWGYELMEVEVQTYAGHAVRSWVFVSSRMALLPREVPPTESYMRQLRDGAADQFLDPAYQAWLSSIETVSSAGLPMDYHNTPAKSALYMALALGTAAALAGFLSHM